MKNLFKSEKSSLLFVFAFFDGLAVASGALFGYFFPKLVSDIFGANFGSNDLIWFKFVLLPGFEFLLRELDVEGRIVRVGYQFTDVVGLEVDHFIGVFQGLLARGPSGHVGLTLGLRRQSDLAHDHIAGEPGLGVEHGEGVPLVLHADVEEVGIFVPHHALVEPWRIQAIVGPELQVVRQEGEGMLVAGTQDDGIHVPARAVGEVDRRAVNPG